MTWSTFAASSAQVLLIIAVPVFWWAVLLFSTRREPRWLRNGVFAVLASWSLVAAVTQLIGLIDGGAVVVQWTVTVWAVLLVLGAMALPIFLIWNGVTMVRRESRRLGNLLSLLAGLALAAMPAVILLPMLWYSWVTLTFASLVVGLFLTAAYLFVIVLAHTLVYAVVARRFRGNAVIVLGSQVPGGRVTPLLRARLEAGLAAARRSSGTDTPVPLVPSGGQGADEPASEGQVMGSWLLNQGVPEDLVLIEDQARTTKENLTLSAALLAARGIKPSYLVATNNYHAPRAALQALDLGFDAQVIGGRTAWYYLPSAYLREFVAILNSRRGWVLAAVFPCVAFAALVGWLAMQGS